MYYRISERTLEYKKLRNQGLTYQEIANLNCNKIVILEETDQKTINAIENLSGLEIVFQKNKGYLRISNEKNRKFLSWNINKDLRQKGFGYKMLSEYLLSSKDNYFAIIKKSNLASIRLVKKVGFRYIKKIRDGILLYSFTKKN